MALHIRVPRNDALLKKIGPYASHLRLGGTKTSVQSQIKKKGLAGYESSTQAALFAVIETDQRSGVFFDIGAHVGIYSALIGTIFRKLGTTCFAFEPTPETAVKAIDLRNRNNLTYPIIQIALSSEKGQVEFFLSPKAETSNSLNRNFRPGATSIKVNRETLDNMVEAGLPYPTLMKIDVETHEPFVLSGAKKTISTARPYIVCEFLPGENVALTHEILEWLASENYRFYPLDESTEPQSIPIMGARFNINQRDWLLSPNRLTSQFFAAKKKWSAAIADCGPLTNIDVKLGQKIPTQCFMEWNLGSL